MSVPVRTTAIENSFHENSQRPPVEPGAETVQSGEPVGSTVSGWGSPGKFTTMGRSSPVSMPSVSHAHIAEKVGFHGGGGARGGREACEGGCGGPGSRSPPAYLRWARHLHILLQDPDGVALFRRYLEAEGQVHADTLDFWFACEGLRKQTDAENVMRLVKVIYRRYFVKMELGIGSDLRREVHQRIKESGSGSGGLAVSVFDRAQQQVERLITDTMYPNFLRSELYLQHVQAMQAGSNTTSTGSDSSLSSSSGSGGNSGGGGAYGGGSNTTSSGSGGGGVQASTGGGYLATLHEDCELESHAASTVPAMSSRDAPRGSAALPLTRDMLLATQKRRASELRPKPEAYAGLYLQTHAKPSSNWVHHSSYNPVSRQDSELQSLSSDARTDSDCLSMTDTSSIREGSGSHHRYSKKQYQLHCKQVKENASLNRDPYMHHTVIPRTQRVQKEQTYPMKPDEFAAILIEKLENLKKDQETKESLDRKLMETGEITDNVGSIGPTTLADAIRGKLRVEDDGDDQDILDQHVSRVWSDRTPGLASPPEFLRRPRPPIPPNHGKMSSSNVPPSMMSPFSMPMHMYQSKTHQRHSHSHSRKEKDVFSNFSSDSGNVHDFTEGSEHRMHVPKSKSMPEYTDTLQSSHDGRFRQTGFRDWSVSGSGSGGGSRRWSSKKTELTDSGVSVVSDTPSLAHTNKDRRVLSWLMESDKQHMVGGGLSQVCGGGGGSGIGGGDSTSSCGGKSHRCGSSRSGSLERPPRPVTTGGGGARGGSGGQGAAQPAQPFVADPSMPPLPSPHTPDQLEEARRRLLEDETRTKQPRPRFPNKSVEPSASHSHSSGSTLRRSGGGGGGSRGSSRGAEPPLPAPPPIHDAPCTIVVFSFCDEQFPYRTKIPGQHVTLRQFKEYLPKKGLYRYFFKTECEDLDMKVIQEEIVDDNEVLPLWEGKVMAQVKPVE